MIRGPVGCTQILPSYRGTLLCSGRGIIRSCWGGITLDQHLRLLLQYNHYTCLEVIYAYLIEGSYGLDYSIWGYREEERWRIYLRQLSGWACLNYSSLTHECRHILLVALEERWVAYLELMWQFLCQYGGNGNDSFWIGVLELPAQILYVNRGYPTTTSFIIYLKKPSAYLRIIEYEYCKCIDEFLFIVDIICSRWRGYLKLLEQSLAS